MFKHFILSIVLIIQITALFPHYVYGEENTNEDSVNREFDLLCDETILTFIEREKGDDILNGKNLKLTKDVLDFSFTWWNSSSIKGMNNLLDEYHKKTKKPEKPLEVSLLTETNINVSTIPKEPRDDISYSIKKESIKIPKPEFSWTLSTTVPSISLSYDKKEFFEVGMSTQRQSWRNEAIVAGVATAIGVAAHFLAKREFFENWPPPTPSCWTACALGEPEWKRPRIDPNKKMSVKEWRNHPELQRWYPTPDITRPEEYNYLRNISFGISLAFTSKAIRNLFSSKTPFPETN